MAPAQSSHLKEIYRSPSREPRLAI